MFYFVYVLKSSKDNGFYIGYTNDLKRRVELHNMGNSPSTKNRRPLSLTYFEKYNTIKDAMKREKQIKSYKGGNAFKKLIGGLDK